MLCTLPVLVSLKEPYPMVAHIHPLLRFTYTVNVMRFVFGVLQSHCECHDGGVLGIPANELFITNELLRMSCFYMFLRDPSCAWPAWVGPEPNCSQSLNSCPWVSSRGCVWLVVLLRLGLPEPVWVVVLLKQPIVVGFTWLTSWTELGISCWPTKGKGGSG